MKLGLEELSIIVEGLRLRIRQLSSSVEEINQNIENLETEDGTKAPAIMQNTSPAGIASFSDGAEDMPIKSLKCTIIPVQAGTGDPAPDNIRPITGWDGVTVVRTGKNLLNTTVYTYTKNGVTITRNSDGTYHVYGTPTGTADFNLAASVDLVVGQRYILSGCPAGGGSNTYKLDLYMYGSAIDYGNGVSFISSAVSALPRIVIYENAGAVDLTFAPMLRLASMSDATYEPYQGSSYPISWESKAGTVYGGYVDVAKGELHVTHGYVDLGTLTWTNSGTAISGKNRFLANVTDLKPAGESSNIADLICTSYKTASWNDTYNGVVGDCIGARADESRIAVFDDALSGGSASNFKSAVSGVMLVYELTQETVIDIDPVTISTLLGNNNVYCDTGTVEVEYAADTKMYIDNAVAAVTPEPEPSPEPEQDDAPPEEEESEEAEPAPEEEEEEAEPATEEEEAAEEEEAEPDPVVKRATRKK